MEKRRLILSVNGMSCHHCVARVERALKQAGGEEVRVDLVTGKAQVRFSGDAALLVSAVKEAGYEAKVADEGAV